MKVILDQQQKPKGVFIPLTEWEQLRAGVDSGSDLYKIMDELTQKSVFDMNPEEFKDHLNPVTENLIEEAQSQGLYFSYPANNPEEPRQFIHEYLNGKKVLIEIDELTGKEHFLKNL